MILQLIGETLINFGQIPLDSKRRMRYDSKANNVNDKLLLLFLDIFEGDICYRHLYLTFYFKLDGEIIDIIVNDNSIKINYNSDNEGFMSGSLEDFIKFIKNACVESNTIQYRVIGNLLYTFLKTKYNILLNNDIRKLSDTTFVLVPPK